MLINIFLNYVNNFLSYSKDSSKLYDVIYSSYIDDNNITKDNIFNYLFIFSI